MDDRFFTTFRQSQNNGFESSPVLSTASEIELAERQSSEWLSGQYFTRRFYFEGLRKSMQTSMRTTESLSPPNPPVMTYELTSR